MSESRWISPTEIARLARVQPPTVSNWMKRFDDFPEGKQLEGSKRLRYNLNEVTQWLEKRQLVGTQRASITALATLDPEERRNLLGTLFVVLQNIESESETDVDVVMETYRTLNTSEHASLLNFDLSLVVHALPELIETYRDLSDPERADVLVAFDESSEGRAQPAISTPSVLVEFLAGLIGDETGVVVDLASGKGRVLEYLEREGIGSELYGVDINASLVTQAGQVAALLKSGIKYAVGDSLTNALPGPAQIVIADPPLKWESPTSWANISSFASISPVPRDPASAFIIRAIQALKPEGYGFVLSGVSLLQAGADAKEFRRQLIQKGCVRAVVSLPPRLRPETLAPIALWILGPPNPQLGKVVMADASMAPLENLGSDGPVVRAIRAELTGDDANLDEKYAVSVSPLSLMTDDVILRPNAWVSKKRDLIEPQEQLARAREGIAQLASITGEISLHATHLDIGHTEPALVTLGTLQGRRVIKILRTLPARSSEEGIGPRVLEQRVLTGALDAGEARRLLDNDTPALQVEPGDIVVGLGLSGVKAVVWQEDGWVAGSSVQIIRARPEHVDATFLAAAIAHPRNRAHVDPGAFRVQANLTSFEVPDLALDEQKKLSALLDDISRVEKDARSRFERLLQAKKELSEALGSGTIALRENHE